MIEETFGELCEPYRDHTPAVSTTKKHPEEPVPDSDATDVDEYQQGEDDDVLQIGIENPDDVQEVEVFDSFIFLNFRM